MSAENITPRNMHAAKPPTEAEPKPETEPEEKEDDTAVALVDVLGLPVLIALIVLAIASFVFWLILG